MQIAFTNIHTSREVKVRKELDIVGSDFALNVYWGDNSTTRIGTAEHAARLAKRAEFLKGQQ
jgi:hypothetical protein|tara:strand:+ start:23 stop:208 length:186 start_codon:yes stop_codon:yes gene_type:complete